MDEDETADSTPPTTLRFGFLIEKKIEGKVQELSIQTDNQGIPEAEVILIIQAWLEKFSDLYKDKIKENLNFFKK